MSEPLVGRPHMPGYGVPETLDGALEWDWALERLRRCRNFFLATTRPDGRPHAMPVWGCWVHGMFVFSTAITSVKSRNLLANPNCVVTTEDGHEAVVIEGTAKVVTKDEIPDFFPAYKEMYGYAIPDDEKWAVVPRQAFGFVEDDTFATSATKWRWEP